MEEKHTHAREALEHYRTASKEQRDQDQRRHEHQVQELQVALRQASDTLTGKNHELMQLNRDNVRLAEQAGHLDKELLKSRSDLRRAEQALTTMQSLEVDHRALKTRWAEETQAAERLRGELAAAREVVAVEREARQQADAIATRTTARLEVFEEMVAKLGEKASSSEQPVG